MLTPDSEITYSTEHPHEPEIPPAFDPEGRCLVCGLMVEIDALRARVAALEEAGDGLMLLATYTAQNQDDVALARWREVREAPMSVSEIPTEDDEVVTIDHYARERFRVECSCGWKGGVAWGETNATDRAMEHVSDAHSNEEEADADH